MSSILESLVEKYPTAAWDWSSLSRNPAISFEFISNHSELQWKPAHVSRNAGITEGQIRARLDYPWDYAGLCSNSNLPFAFFNEFVIKPDVVHHVHWHLLSANAGISLEDIRANSHYCWNDYYLSMNMNVNSNYILNEGGSRLWNIPSLCANPGITERDIFKNTLKSALGGKFKWDYRNLSANPNLPIAFVIENFKQDWNFHSISKNASLNDIQTYPKIPWDAHGLSTNMNISFTFVKIRKDIAWHKPSLLTNGAISLNDIVNNMNWFKNGWSDKKNSIAAYLCGNPTITVEWISENIDDVDWRRLSCNRLGARS